MTVRDPTTASGRLTWWNSRTDGESPDGRQRAGVRASCAAASGVAAARGVAPVPVPRPRQRRTATEGQEASRWPASTSSRRCSAPSPWPPPSSAAPARNPVVGAVVLDRGGQVVGDGAHTGGPGDPHAEIVALAEAGDRGRGRHRRRARLEPCNHTGRTGPCTAGADRRRRRAGSSSPSTTPTRSRPGEREALRGAGVEVESGLLARRRPSAVNEAWLLSVRLGRPFVTWKYAATLDGRSAAADGTSRWITVRAGPRRRAPAPGQADAVVVGIGTVLADDP